MIAALGLMAGRVTVGSLLAMRGAQKALGWFDGTGPDAAAGFMESLGFEPGESFATAASSAEMAGGAAIALGFGGPFGPATALAALAFSAGASRRHDGFFAHDDDIELPLLYAAACIALASTGFGALALDRAFGLERRFRDGTVMASAVLSALGIAGIALAQRH